MTVSPMTAVAIRAEAHGEIATSPMTAVVMGQQFELELWRVGQLVAAEFWPAERTLAP